MDPRESHGLKNDPDRRVWGMGPQPEFRVTVTLALSDAERLWNAARDRLLAAPGGCDEMVEETIGPVEAPQLADCIALLCAPSLVPGCSVDDFWVDAMPGLPSQDALAA
ncbi:hypothetical protein FPZ54_06740 [Sphingomonas suaedae]|uniref:Uncharacterized protein n=1 Tax=Sphingomonas suaedae TaxID=2599297 RepID=A0A518RE89_9SPHN|nr:hypothetical protein FPZ54_06740 [Sphingomonas suaedae]